MEAIEVYSKCKESVYNTKALFNHYEKYHGCASISYLDEKRNDILRKIACSYASMLKKTDKTLAVNNLLTINNEEDVEVIADCPLFIDHMIDHLEKNEDHIIDLLKDTTEQKKISYLYNFDSSYQDADQLINRMEKLIRDSQIIHQTYYRASA
ncbi:hypothetical protein HQ865_05240 [Mucilaginibacter mali]|uniref:Uncharacterized protein n=1 Tax=Mucilaginibacter mali TaxID=2740462 RepID=A0A7D4UNP3_9SPHI|nr:hypothetical protein [Mucilaginibacter mali]QKJ29180.1 hypothetical protein HQ865_05240 [Mucilaginibacter mali]